MYADLAVLFRNGWPGAGSVNCGPEDRSGSLCLGVEPFVDSCWALGLGSRVIGHVVCVSIASKVKALVARLGAVGALMRSDSSG